MITIGNFLSYTDSNLTTGQTYYYKVSAINIDGESAMTEEVAVTADSDSSDGNGLSDMALVAIIGAIIAIIVIGGAFYYYRKKKK